MTRLRPNLYMYYCAKGLYYMTRNKLLVTCALRTNLLTTGMASLNCAMNSFLSHPSRIMTRALLILFLANSRILCLAASELSSEHCCSLLVVLW